MSDAPYVVHIWPGKWNHSSLDPTCLATVMYLQLAIPGRFKVAPCSNPDRSPNGQLPFLTHGHTVVSTFPSIVAFVSSLAKSSSASSGVTDLDAPLTSLQKAEKVALYAHVESHVSDLVSHLFYGNDTNFWGLTSPALASDMPIPQRYYVSRRIREAYKPRLEAAGLWSLPNPEEEQKGLFDKDKKKKRDYKVTFTRAFEREKILDKAKTVLGVYANYLSRNQFFFGDRPTSLDVYFAAHTLLMADPPFPDAVLQIQLLESFPGLIEHARRIEAQVVQAPSYEQFTPSESLLNTLVPRPFSAINVRTEVDPADVQYQRKTLLYTIAMAAAGAAYCYSLVFAIDNRGKGSEDSDREVEIGGDSEEEEGESTDASGEQ